MMPHATVDASTRSHHRQKTFTLVAQRTALVTGGSSGIGYAIAQRSAEAGYAVTISGRREEKLRAAAAELRKSCGPTINDVVCDAARKTRSSRSCSPTRTSTARSTCWSTTPASASAAPSATTQTKYLDMQLDVNIRSTVICTREALPMLRESAKANETAYIINLASIAGRYGQPWLSIYAATKAAVANWSNGIHKEFQNEGIRVTALSPAFVETPMTEFAKQGGVPGEKMIRPEDLSSAVLWLLSLSPNVRIPEIVFERVGDDLF